MKELLERKAGLIGQLRALVDKAEADNNRSFTVEEQEQYDNLNTAIDATQAEVDAAKRQAEIRAHVDELEAALEKPVESHPLHQDEDRAQDSGFAAFQDAMLSGCTRSEAFDAVIKASKRSEEAKAFNAYLRTGIVRQPLRQAALKMDDDTAGGFLVVPEYFMAQLLKDLDRMVWMRQIATVLPMTNAERVSIPTLATDPSDAAFTTELSVGAADTAMVFGKRFLSPHPMAKYIRVSKDLMKQSAIPIESLVRERLAYKFAIPEENSFLNGTGDRQPLGVFTASTSGIYTDRDVSTGNTSTSIQTDGLIECKYTLESQYLANLSSLRWIFHRDAVKQIRKLKDGEGRYVWQEGITRDGVNTILDIPVIVSEYAPNTFTTLLYVGILGDFSYYWIAETFGLEIQRLVELLALTNEDCYVGRLKVDGMPVLSKAFARVKLG